jgi:hypothetical protein
MEFLMSYAVSLKIAVQGRQEG